MKPPEPLFVKVRHSQVLAAGRIAEAARAMFAKIDRAEVDVLRRSVPGFLELHEAVKGAGS